MNNSDPKSYIKVFILASFSDKLTFSNSEEIREHLIKRWGRDVPKDSFNNYLSELSKGNNYHKPLINYFDGSWRLLDRKEAVSYAEMVVLGDAPKQLLEAVAHLDKYTLIDLAREIGL